VLAVALVVVACGSNAGESLFTDPPAGSSSGNVDAGPTDPFGDRGDASDGGNDDGGAVCAAVNAEAKLVPVNMVVMYDRSGSMGDTTEDPSFDPNQRWVPVGQAMKSFFNDPSSAGIRAALTYFPTATNSCTQADYDNPDVALTSLPSMDFATSIDATSPKGDTPTRAAALGAIDQAKAIATAKPMEKTIIVFVTDGEPYGCGIDTDKQSDDEAAAVAVEVGKVKAQFATYVIGIGPSVTNLDEMATAGGTTAFHVQVGNAAQTTSDLLAAMAMIRGTLGRCDFDIPTPPDGRTIDFGKVDVQKISGSGMMETLPYVADCKGNIGWHFDDAMNPKKVLLCSTTCEAVKVDAGGKVNVSFRCVNRPDVTK